MIPSFIADCISDTEFRQRKAREKWQQQRDRIAAAERPETTETLSPNDRLAIARSQKAADDSKAAYERRQARESQANEKERQTQTLRLFEQFWDATPDRRGAIALQYAYVRGFVPMTAGGFQNQAQVDQTMTALKDKAFMAEHFPDRLAEWVKLMEGK